MKIDNSNTYNHSIYFEPTKCKGGMACMKICPVEAIRVRNGKAIMLEDKCIDCGECEKVCKNNAIIPLTNTFQDFSKFKYTVAIPSLALYAQFDRNIKPNTILASLQKIGFDEVVDTTHACVTVVNAIKKYIKEYTGKKPLISAFCPTVVKLIQIRYPELVKNLIPIIAPMELAAREAKKKVSHRLGIKKEDIGVIYITPCPSKMIQISENSGKFYSDFDGAIPISEVYHTLFTVISQSEKSNFNEIEHYDISGFGLNFARMGGIVSMMDDDRSIAVSGINDISYILDDIETGKLKNIDFVEMHGCLEGCIGGTMVVDNTYIARTKLLQIIKYFGESKVAVGKRDIYANSELYYKSIYEPLPLKPLDIDLKKAITKISRRKEIISKLPDIDCGACGSPSCKAFAEDVIQGETKINDCVFFYIEELKKKTENNLKLIKTK